jgi:hypothetical protein
MNSSALGGAQPGAGSALSGAPGTEPSEEEKSDQKKKRPATDKQTAFVEYKTQTDEGRSLETAILKYRDELKTKKSSLKNLTLSINSTKAEMDRVQQRLAHK